MFRHFVSLFACFVIACTSAAPAFAGPTRAFYSSYIHDTIYAVDDAGVRTVFVSGLQGPGGLAFDATGNLYTANWDNGTVSKITQGGVVTTYASGFNTPWGLVFDTAGNLYVSNAGNGSGTTISKVTANGASNTIFATGLSQPMGLAFDTDGFLYAANRQANTISKISPSGQVSLFATLPTGIGPHGLAFDTSGFLYASVLGANNTGFIDKIDSNGNVSLFVSNVYNPYAMHFDQANLLFLSTDNFPDTKILTITTNGQVTQFTNYAGAWTGGGDVIPVPEPASLFVLASTAGLLMLRRRGR